MGKQGAGKEPCLASTNWEELCSKGDWSVQAHRMLERQTSASTAGSMPALASGSAHALPASGSAMSARHIILLQLSRLPGSGSPVIMRLRHLLPIHQIHQVLEDHCSSHAILDHMGHAHRKNAAVLQVGEAHPVQWISHLRQEDIESATSPCPVRLW